MDTQIPVTLIDLFKLIGSPIFVGFFISNFLENVPAFQKLASMTKFLVVCVVCGVAAVVSYALVTYTPSAFIEAVQPWYGQIVALLVVVAADYWHKKVTKAGKVITVTAQPIDETNRDVKG